MPKIGHAFVASLCVAIAVGCDDSGAIRSQSVGSGNAGRSNDGPLSSAGSGGSSATPSQAGDVSIAGRLIDGGTLVSAAGTASVAGSLVTGPGGEDCAVMPTCLIGDVQVSGNCPSNATCYWRIQCGIMIQCQQLSSQLAGAGAGASGKSPLGNGGAGGVGNAGAGALGKGGAIAFGNGGAVGVGSGGATVISYAGGRAPIPAGGNASGGAVNLSGGMGGTAGSPVAVGGSTVAMGGRAGYAGSRAIGGRANGSAGTSTVTPPPPEGCVMTEIDKVNVVVFKDATPTGADSEGRMWVGGNLKVNKYSVNATDIAELRTTCNDWGLIAGGNIIGEPIVQAGKIAYGGTIDVYDADCGAFHMQPVDFAALEAKLTGYSATFAAYPTNGTTEQSNSTLKLTGTDPTLNVFSATADQVNATTYTKFDVPATSSVIVNISGDSVIWTSGSFLLPDGGQSCKGGSTAWCARILYNVYEATSVSIGGIGIQGSILAPYATFNGKGGNVDGQVIVKYLNGITEYHPYPFNGCLLLPQ